MIELFTSRTPGYPWWPAFEASLKRHCNVPWRAIDVEACPHDPGTPAKIIQHGSFLDKLILSHPDPVILFLDADMICQRPFDQFEFVGFGNLHGDQVALGINGSDGETLDDEAANLSPRVDATVLEGVFPGYADILSFNTGFVAARRSTYARLYDMARALMPAAALCFEHYARVQWVMCYVIGRWLRRVELPQDIHLHGCCGKPVGMTLDANGDARLNGRLVAFRHAINLNPPKCVRGETAASPTDALYQKL